jgi:hypothetical protein
LFSVVLKFQWLLRETPLSPNAILNYLRYKYDRI